MALLPTHKSAFHKEVTWLCLALKDHSGLNGENRLWRGCTEVQEREGGNEGQLGGHRERKVVHPHHVILLSSCGYHGVSPVR